MDREREKTRGRKVVVDDAVVAVVSIKEGLRQLLSMVTMLVTMLMTMLMTTMTTTTMMMMLPIRIRMLLMDEELPPMLDVVTKMTISNCLMYVYVYYC